jgi:hypothetical protein
VPLSSLYILRCLWYEPNIFNVFEKKVVSILISKIFPGSGHLHFAFFTTTTITATTTTSASRQAITLF